MLFARLKSVPSGMQLISRAASLHVDRAAELNGHTFWPGGGDRRALVITESRCTEPVEHPVQTGSSIAIAVMMIYDSTAAPISSQHVEFDLSVCG